MKIVIIISFVIFHPYNVLIVDGHMCLHYVRHQKRLFIYLKINSILSSFLSWRQKATKYVCVDVDNRSKRRRRRKKENQAYITSTLDIIIPFIFISNDFSSSYI
jgi:hypothetical protein